MKRISSNTQHRATWAQSGIAALFLLSIISFLASSRASAVGLDDFVTTWDTTNAGSSDGSSIRIPTSGGGYAYQVDWNNDGDLDDPNESTVHTGTVTHTFASPGVHTIRISGAFPEIRFNNQGDKLKFLSVDQWGSQQWRAMAGAFYGCTNLSVTSLDAPDLSAVTSTEQMFRSVQGTLEVGAWDTSSVTNMRSMFWLTTSDLDVGTWDTGNVTDMQTMFRESSADPDVSIWDTSNVANTSQMFRWATNADPAVDGWNTGNLVTAAGMFQDISTFTGDLGSWDTSSLQDVSAMFARGASTPNLADFDTSNVTNFSFMFFRADTVPDVSNWDTSSAINMNSVFSNVGNTNPDVSGWDTSNVTDMSRMFRSATLADPDMSGWNIENVPDMTDFLVGSSFSTANYDAALAAWGTQSLVSNVTFHAGNANFCDSGAERSTLTTTFNWTLIDGVQDCTPPTPAVGPDLADGFDTGVDDDDLVTSLVDVDVVVGCTGSDNVVNVFWDQPVTGTLLGTEACDDELSASIAVTGLAEGFYQLTYSETKQGFESAQSVVSTIEVDVTPPAQPMCVPTLVLVGIGDSFTVACSSLELDSTLHIDQMLCTPSPAAVAGVVSCTGTAGPNSSPGDGEIDTSDDSITVTDIAGNVSTSSTGVTVDVEPPLIVRVGPAQSSVVVGDAYLDAGATCTDDRDLACSVVVGGDIVDTAAVGEYVAIYSAVDEAGNAAGEVFRSVIVVPVTTIATSVPPTTAPTSTSPTPSSVPTTTASAVPTAATLAVPLARATAATPRSPTRFPTTTSRRSPTSTTTIGTAFSTAKLDVVDEQATQSDLDGIADAAFVNGLEDGRGMPATWIATLLLAVVAVNWWFLGSHRPDSHWA